MAKRWFSGEDAEDEGTKDVTEEDAEEGNELEKYGGDRDLEAEGVTEKELDEMAKKEFERPDIQKYMKVKSGVAPEEELYRDQDWLDMLHADALKRNQERDDAEMNWEHVIPRISVPQTNIDASVYRRALHLYRVHAVHRYMHEVGERTQRQKTHGYRDLSKLDLDLSQLPEPWMVETFKDHRDELNNQNRWPTSAKEEYLTNLYDIFMGKGLPFPEELREVADINYMTNIVPWERDIRGPTKKEIPFGEPIRGHLQDWEKEQKGIFQDE